MIIHLISGSQSVIKEDRPPLVLENVTETEEILVQDLQADDHLQNGMCRLISTTRG